MANTNDLKILVEPYIRNALSEEFETDFENSELSLALTSGGDHKFDAIAKDRSVIAGVKTSRMLPSGSVGAGPIKSAYTELYFLSLIAADTRLLVLTDRGFFEHFRQLSEGRVAAGIEIRYMKLPDEIEKRVAEILEESSKEIGKRTNG